jgi:hypothetical protein
VKSRLNGEGYRFLSTPASNRFINQARSELDQMYCWPYREKSATGSPRLTISDLGLIEKVFDTSNGSTPLMRYDFSTWSTSTAASRPAVRRSATTSPGPPGLPWSRPTRPARTRSASSTGRSPSTSPLDGDVPLAPVQFHSLLVNMATQKALRANRIHREADAYEATIQQEIQAMLFALPPGTPDGPDAYVGFTGASEDC